MAYYKDPQGGVHFLESETSEHLLPAGSIRISDDEAKAVIAALAPAPSERDSLIAEIRELEATVTQRRLREAALGADNGWLRDLDAQIAALRTQLQNHAQT